MHIVAIGGEKRRMTPLAGVAMVAHAAAEHVADPALDVPASLLLPLWGQISRRRNSAGPLPSILACRGQGERRIAGPHREWWTVQLQGEWRVASPAVGVAVHADVIIVVAVGVVFRLKRAAVNELAGRPRQARGHGRHQDVEVGDNVGLGACARLPRA